jgi:Trk K+ transport system NAD-binding subunit
VADSELAEPVYPPAAGTWLVCGYGRFGKAVYGRLKKQGLNVVVIEATPEKTGMPHGGVVVGRGTEASTLTQAGVEQAAGLVAGTDDDANNLSIIMTARDLNRNLFVVARQNHRDNQPLFDAVRADIVMHPSAIIANRIRVLLATPMLYEFMQLAKSQDDDWACELISRVVAVVSTTVPDVWETPIDEHSAGAVYDRVKYRGGAVTVADLMRAPDDRTRPMPAIPLMLHHDRERILLPDVATRVRPGDRVLWCGRPTVRRRMSWILRSEHMLAFAVTGEVRPQGALMRWLERRRQHAAPRPGDAE